MQNKKRKIISDTFLYATANYFSQGLGMFNAVLMRRFMGPELMGAWALLQVILGYCGYASFGTTKALMRDYPYLRGLGENQKADNLKNLVFTFSLFGSLIPAFILIGYIFLNAKTLPLPLLSGLWFLVGFLFLQRFYDLQQSLLRSDRKFHLISRLVIWNAVAGITVTLILVFYGKLYGLLLGTLLVTLASALYIHRSSNYQFKFHMDRQELWRELKLGIPLVASTFLLEFLKSLDKIIIAKELGLYHVGVYSIAMMASSYIFSLPMMFAHVWFPNLQEEYGKRKSAAGIKNYLLKPVKILLILVPILCAAGVFLIPIIVHCFLPKFLPGLSSMKIYLMGIFFLLLSQYCSSFLVTLDRYLIQIPILAVSIGINYGLAHWFLALGFGTSGIAAAAASSFAFYGIANYCAATKSFYTVSEIAKSSCTGFCLITTALGLIWILDRIIPNQNIWTSSFSKFGIYMIFMAFPIYWLEKQTAVIQSAWAVILHRFSLTPDPTRIPNPKS